MPSKLISLLFLTLAFIAPTNAQTPMRDLAAQRSAMQKLSVMHGTWLGQGERYLPSGETYRFTQTLRIAPQSSGLLTTIAGQSLHHGNEAEKKPGSGSFAVVMFDETGGGYRFHSFGFGQRVEADASFPSPRVFRWTVAAGPALLRFTIDLTQDGVWNELGERSGDGGKTWQPTNKLIAYRTALR
ncbi:MAG: hypothetical protein AAF221_10275 [Pseudomonadota bacterium]